MLPDEITENDLNRGARNELKTLQPETQERVARHLAMVAALIDENPELAHQHAISASRRAGRIPVAREALAATAYRIGDYALALRELRTHRRLSGSQGNIALMVEAERALGRPQKALETGIEAVPEKLSAAQRAQLAIAMSGARLDLGQTQQALLELEIAELDPKRAYSYSPELFAAYSAVLEELGRESEARVWRARAEAAEDAINEQLGASDEMEVTEVIEYAAAPVDDAYDDALGGDARDDDVLDGDALDEQAPTDDAPTDDTPDEEAQARETPAAEAQTEEARIADPLTNPIPGEHADELARESIGERDGAAADNTGENTAESSDENTEKHTEENTDEVTDPGAEK